MPRMKKRRNRLTLFIVACVYVIFFRLLPGYAGHIILQGDKQFEYGRELMEKGRYETAIYEFERFIRFFPDDLKVLRARFSMGVCYLELKAYGACRKVFFAIVREKDDPAMTARAMLLIGESYYRQRIFTEAGVYLARIIKKNPSVEIKNAALYRLAWTRMHTGQWKAASRAFRDVTPGTILYQNAQALAEKSLEGEELPQKKPVVAGTLAAVLPGLGHAYVRRYRDAATAFVVNGLFIWATMESYNQDHKVLAGIIGAVELGWYAGNIYSAANCAHKHNRKIKDDFISGLTEKFDMGLLFGRKGDVGVAFTFRF